VACIAPTAPISSTLSLVPVIQVAAEKVGNKAESIPQALKRRHILNDLAARVELVPFPRPFELDFFRSLPGRLTHL